MGSVRPSLLCSILVGIVACLPLAVLADQRAADKPFTTFLPLTQQGGGSAPASAPDTTPVPSATPVASAPLPPVATPPAAPITATTTITPSDFELQVLDLTNQQRVANGCQPLVLSLPLSASAREHSQDMATNNYFNHTGSDGSAPGARMRAVGYNWYMMGENIEAGATTPQDVVDQWMASASHRANILNCGFKDIGIGYANDPTDTWVLPSGAVIDGYYDYWTQDFGAQP